MVTTDEISDKLRNDERQTSGLQVSRNTGFIDCKSLHGSLHTVVACGFPQKIDGEAVIDMRGGARSCSKLKNVRSAEDKKVNDGCAIYRRSEFRERLLHY